MTLPFFNKTIMRYLQLFCVVFIIIFTAFLTYNLLSDVSVSFSFRSHTHTFNPTLTKIVLYNQHRYQDFLNVNSGKNRYLAVKFLGRLGNCMFQYASILGLAKLTGRQAVVFYEKNLMPVFPNLSVPIFADISHFTKIAHLNSWFDIKTFEEEALSSLRYSDKLIQDLKWYSKKPMLIINGYFQSWKYFSSVHSQLTTYDFNFDDHVQTKINKTMQQLRKIHNMLVGIHIRREDYITSEINRRFGYLPAQESYIKMAIKHFQNKYPTYNILFVIPSQEKKWCQQIFDKSKLSIHYTDFTVPAEDMYILTQTDHLITTVGSFGWWAGYFNKGTVIYQKHIAVEGSQFSKIAQYPEDFFPPRFITINETGAIVTNNRRKT